ncbi:hypothetical protein NIES2100_18960 [Calothrix sp. NIES-2100]|uniref:hypothetical protein n=1 Tax=Calothrix sp. NIES-2100 TaxID=1954172 RepID=UPI000B5FA2D8|nr:hypothetical protein NIES2100_18960 [Calothrix sp. NIES-2100]
MGQLNIDNLDDEPISFDLTDEDVQSIKGGVAAIEDISIPPNRPFPIKITAIRIHPIRIYPIRIFVIQIKAPPPVDPLAAI